MFKSYDDMLKDLEREMRRMSDDMLVQVLRYSGGSGEVWSPRADVYETADAVVVKVSVAGLDPDQIELTISADNNYLSLRGVRGDQDEDKTQRLRYHQLEVYYGPFERVVPLPKQVQLDRDNLNATYKDGFLKVTLPKLGQPDVKVVEIKE